MTEEADREEYRDRRQYWRRLRQIDLGCFRLQRSGVYWESRQYLPQYKHESARCWKFNHQIILKQLPAYRAKRQKLLAEYGNYSRKEIEARRQDTLLAYLSKLNLPRPGPPPPRWRPPSTLGIPIASRYDFDETMPASVTEVWPRPDTSESSGTTDSSAWIDELASSRSEQENDVISVSSSTSTRTAHRPRQKAKIIVKSAKIPPTKNPISYGRKSLGSDPLSQPRRKESVSSCKVGTNPVIMIDP
eukprot:GHVU01002157.1.p1 GENE.GHVU01002157.1~~GHVU01002157.1.p1  ORF type:complete len:246 (+),score=13.23 GHVU01002157.1:1080-1817(+)